MSKPVEKPAPAVKSPSPKKKVEPKSPQKTRPSEPVAKEPAPKAASPKKVEKKIESPSLSSGWGSLDVTTSGIGEWATAATETKTTPNAWARGSPLLTPTAVSTVESVSALPTVVPGSPKDIQIPRPERSAVASATSPKQYLKLGKWESAATTNLSLQFGSFSLNGVESTSPRGWSATTTTTTTTTSGNGNKTVSKTETQSAWSKTASPEKKTPLSPARKLESDASARKGPTTSAPPGLSVESGRVTPKSSQSPRTFAPSAPSPASLPKPDDVKRSTPTRAQGHFQSQTTTQTASKIGSGSGFSGEFGSKSSGLYQASYNQYSMDLGGRASSSTAGVTIAQSQVASSASTPKNTGNARNSGAVGSAQSPSHAAQQSAQLQFQQSQQSQAPQQTQTQAQQQQTQQKQHGQQSQSQSQSQQSHAQSQQQQQGVPQHHPQGYHPHYAPPPPPGMALPYNPYNYASYYQGYGYYQNPQVRRMQ